jgi:proton-dependent oligopeptide transporter, POT family
VPARTRQPSGVLTLALVEMWERFSFYGMVALLVLYLIQPEDGPFPPGPGQGFSEADAAALFGVYSALILGAPLVGGWIGDRLIGPRRALVLGGILIAAGHFILLTPSTWVFWAGLMVIAAGTGLLKPNISTVLGLLYTEGDPRRDGGFSLFYFGINLGAFTAPLICGWLANAYSWRLAFAVAGLGMLAGLAQYAIGRRRLGSAGLAVPRAATQQQRRRALAVGVIALAAIAGVFAVGTLSGGFTAAAVSGSVTVVIIAVAIAVFAALLRRFPSDTTQHRHLLAFLILFIASVVYFALSSQAGSTITEFTQDWVQRDVGGFTVPTSWLLSLNPVLVVAFAPIFAALWTRLANRAPTTPTKVALSMVGVGISFLIIAIPGFASQEGRTSSAAWILATFLVLTWAELLVVPISLSTTTELAPPGLTGQMLGLWYLAAAAGAAIGGQFARLVESLGFGGYFLASGLVVVALGGAFMGLRPVWSRLLSPIR